MRARGGIVALRSDRVLMTDGDSAERDVIEHPGAVAVVALDDTGEDWRVLLIRQYRHPAGRLLWEIPAGLRDVDDEEPQATAVRELAEEAALRAADWRSLVDFFPSPGVSEERIRIYLARGLTEIPPEERDFTPRHEEADMPVRWLELDAAVSRVLAGEIHNANAVAGVLAVAAARARGLDTLRPADAAEE
ncbi:MAG: NUDIX domain-containing protein [Streptosporangiales bacterium]|nr:NUDIX domain-containing protein [Streptosporangiales bacterium]